jgi:hypothetical protein
MRKEHRPVRNVLPFHHHHHRQWLLLCALLSWWYAPSPSSYVPSPSSYVQSWWCGQLSSSSLWSLRSSREDVSRSKDDSSIEIELTPPPPPPPDPDHTAGPARMKQISIMKYWRSDSFPVTHDSGSQRSSRGCCKCLHVPMISCLDQGT